MQGAAIANIRVICDKCNVDIPRVPEAQHYPVFLDEMGQRVDAPKLLRQKAYCGLKRKVSTISQKYIDRMEYELNTIIDMGYADYILIVADYVQEGKRIAKMNNPYKMGYGVGPGRGSGAGSLVNYCMGITALDPLQYNLLFERFLWQESGDMKCTQCQKKNKGKNRKKSVSREEKRSVGSEKNSAKIFQIKQAHCQKIEMIY